MAPIAGAMALIALYSGISKLLGGFMFRCPLKWLTSWDCPGCGSQRALHALLQGHLREAIGYNLLIPFALIYLALLWMGYVWEDSPRIQRLRQAATSPLAIRILLAVVLAWWLLRNLL